MEIYKYTKKNNHKIDIYKYTKVYFIKDKDIIHNLEYIINGIDLLNKTDIEKIVLINKYKDNIKILIFISPSKEIIQYDNIKNLKIINNNLVKFISKNQLTITENISNLLYFSTFFYK